MFKFSTFNAWVCKRTEKKCLHLGRLVLEKKKLDLKIPQATLHTRAHARAHTQSFVKAFLPSSESTFLETYITESWRWCACTSLAIYRSYIYKCTQTFRQLDTLPPTQGIQGFRERERLGTHTHTHTHSGTDMLATCVLWQLQLTPRVLQGSEEEPIRNLSISRAASRPSRMAHTTSDCPSSCVSICNFVPAAASVRVLLY